MGQKKTTPAPKTGLGKNLDLLATSALAIDTIGNLLIDKSDVLDAVSEELARASEVSDSYQEREDFDLFDAAEGLDALSEIMGNVTEKLTSAYRVDGDLLDHFNLCQDHLYHLSKSEDAPEVARPMHEDLTEGRRLLIRFSGQLLTIRDALRTVETNLIQASNLLSEDSFEKTVTKLSKKPEHAGKSPEEIAQLASDIQNDEYEKLTADSDQLALQPIDEAHQLVDDICDWLDKAEITLDKSDRYLEKTVNKKRLDPAVQYDHETMPDAYRKHPTPAPQPRFEELKKRPKSFSLH